MTAGLGCIARAAALGILVASPGFLQPRLASSAFAQASDMAGIGRAGSVSARALVKSIDLPTRTVTLEVAGVLAAAGTKLPDDSLTVADALGSKMVVTGLVVGVDPTSHTISLVDPAGGPIRTVDVVTPEGQQSMKLATIGDTITAIITEAVLVGVEPAA
jgi:hypothetical protein